MNYHPNDVVPVPSLPTPPAAVISSGADTYLGLFIMAAFWAFVSAAVLALSERERAQKSDGKLTRRTSSFTHSRKVPPTLALPKGNSMRTPAAR